MSFGTSEWHLGNVEIRDTYYSSTTQLQRLIDLT